MNSILENIDTIRRNRGYSQEYLAMQIGMKQAGFSLIMSGERELKYNTLLQIANALQMSVIDVITFPDKYVMAKGNGTSTEAVLQIKLDSNRQNYLLNSICDTQTIITCTGLDEFIRNRFEINKVFEVISGQVFEKGQVIERQG